ncbi:hypothetical protein RF11_02571 [Thelohanellus kitauei]|uniref:Uncharacterized protein n=1 Tax=Thelohanellus kitauei TaxID=669202 RepID=A0A0C2MKD7_THEKT|nr:hypothetical protein RF11_02571 [Thelohanellus kitauei]
MVFHLKSIGPSVIVCLLFGSLASTERLALHWLVKPVRTTYNTTSRLRQGGLGVGHIGHSFKFWAYRASRHSVRSKTAYFLKVGLNDYMFHVDDLTGPQVIEDTDQRNVFDHNTIVVKGIGPVSWRIWIFKGILGSVYRIGMGPGFWIP